MALELEDGTGKANAESYAAIADVNDYATKRGLAFNITGEPAIAAAEAAVARDRVAGARDWRPHPFDGNPPRRMIRDDNRQRP